MKLPAFLCAILLTASWVRADTTDIVRRLDLTAPNSDPGQINLSDIIRLDLIKRRNEALERDRQTWLSIRSRVDWERVRDARLEALRRSLGEFPVPPADLKTRVTGTLTGEGYRIDNIVFESRPGVLVTANLYRPARSLASMPGILICHSHHNPKTESELQDMGITWARQGCLVLVPDQPGHGERRQHPFVDASTFAGSFRPSRQDYYFRYYLGMQLHLVGESLIGWMAWDMMRGVDLLLAQPGINAKAIILLGAVAGGGDPAAVTAALDPRITAVAPFNFGGPQPETTFPLPGDAETTFNYLGSGSWESTRNLRLSGRDGFLPWHIVASVAPRGLVYGHEFAWDQERDPVWKRLQTVYGFYDQPERLTFAIGRGRLSGKPPESTHCNNIGPVHRQGIHAALHRWFGLPIPEKESTERHPGKSLLARTPEVADRMRPLHEVAGALADARGAAARARRASLTPEDRRRQLRAEWAALLGPIDPLQSPQVRKVREETHSGIRIRVELLEVEPGILVPVVQLDRVADRGPRALVVMVSQEGKIGLQKERTETIAALLDGGIRVALIDVRGTGESRRGDARGRSSSATAESASLGMTGQPLVGSRLRDLRAVLVHLRRHPDVDRQRLAVWGDSLAPAHEPGRNFAVPLDAEPLPKPSEPLGGLLALLAGLYEEDIRLIHIHGGLLSYRSVLRSPFVYLPHDSILPGVLNTGDLSDVMESLAPRRVHLSGLVDGLNRSVPQAEIDKEYARVRTARVVSEPARALLETLR